MPGVTCVASREELAGLPAAVLAARLAEAYRLIAELSGQTERLAARVEELERQACSYNCCAVAGGAQPGRASKHRRHPRAAESLSGLRVPAIGSNASRLPNRFHAKVRRQGTVAWRRGVWACRARRPRRGASRVPRREGADYRSWSAAMTWSPRYAEVFEQVGLAAGGGDGLVQACAIESSVPVSERPERPPPGGLAFYAQAQQLELPGCSAVIWSAGSR